MPRHAVLGKDEGQGRGASKTAGGVVMAKVAAKVAAKGQGGLREGFELGTGQGQD